MKAGPRVFVFVVFLAMGLSFIATTGVLMTEFREDELWLDFLTSDSHLFLFFPTFAIISLVAFYLPSCAIVDLYWNHLPFGRIRFLVGLLVIVAASWIVAAFILDGKNKSIWLVKPEVLAADVGEPANCAGGGDCARLPVLMAVKNLREVSLSRPGLRPLVRTCHADPLIERAAQTGPKRYCIVTTPYSSAPALKTDQECCRAQALFLTKIAELHAEGVPAAEPEVEYAVLRAPLRIFEVDPEKTTLSMTGLVHGLLLPLKILFLLVLVAISILMTVHLRKIEQLYSHYLVRMETGLLIGTFAVLFFPLMSQAFLQSVDALVGDLGRGNFSNIVPVLSFAFGVWTLLILLYFYRRRDKEAELFAKIGGAAAGIVALVQYEVIIDFLVRTVGSGADWFVLVAMAIAAAVIIVVVMMLMASPRSEAAGDKH
jgi:hypothetical protein